MRKLLFALGAACIALSGMAASLQGAQNFGKSKMLKSTSVKDFHKFKGAKAPASKIKGTPWLSSWTDIITSAEGERVDVTVTSSGLTASMTGLIEYNDEMSASHIVYGENNEVYFYEIFPFLPTGTYFKGVKEGDKISVDLPQAIYYDDSMGEVTEAYCLDLFNWNDDPGWFFPEKKCTLTFSVDEYGTMTAEGLSSVVLLGVGDSETGDWIGLGACELTISTFNEEAVTLPAGYEVTENFWTSVGAEYGWQVNFAQGGKEIYFQGLCERMPETWVKGTVEYDDYTATVSIAQDQYIGDFAGYHIFTKCVEMTIDQNGNIFYEDLMDPDYVYQLVWDIEEETMVAKDKNVVLLFNTSKNDVYFVNDLEDLTLIHQESFEGVPANPYGLEFIDEMEEQGYSIFSFYLPAVSTEGDYLKIDDLSYVVYVDGEEWVFDAEDYMMEDSLEEVPWSFNGNWILKGYQSSEHKLAFFVEGISTLGVQSVYNYDGEETRSDIISIDLEGSAVKDINADKKVANVKYYDAAGREVSTPASGLYIKRITFTDGTTTTVKSIR